jgi:S-adenosylmethionine:tRNA ribosyltransferase-isomerase
MMLLEPGAPAFSLPAHLEAHVPPEARGIARDEVKLLVTARADGTSRHRRFTDLADELRPGDLLVVNDSATVPAALEMRRWEDGANVALHLSTQIAGTLWIVEPRTRAREGDVFTRTDGASVTLLTPAAPPSTRLWFARLDEMHDVCAYLQSHGRPIAYRYVEGRWPIEAYQTLFGRIPGSAEMPSAGRPFTGRMREALVCYGVHFASVTLHTGVASGEHDEAPPLERYTVPDASVRAIEATRRSGGRVIAVGTTVVRALESAVAFNGGVLAATSALTDLVVSPRSGVSTVDGLLTGLHEPQATHLEMLAAFITPVRLARSYTEAVEHGYLWHEFGDVQLIL